ncbi:MAG TPA: hypothetical protein VHA13_02895 [Gammaproteobacteria bacterium]|nr:hypothetical protein [Gammaproteobacteria bacterium]
MGNNMLDEVVAEAVRIEFEEQTGKLFIVFEVKNEKYKQDIKKNWTKDIEYRIIDRSLVEVKDE